MGTVKVNYGTHIKKYYKQKTKIFITCWERLL